jgi:uncharacterized protein (TIGR00369 family)
MGTVPLNNDMEVVVHYGRAKDQGGYKVQTGSVGFSTKFNRDLRLTAAYAKSNAKIADQSHFIQLQYKDCGYEEGWIEFVHKATEFDINRYGTVHGGVIGLFLDTAMGLAAYETGTGNSAPTMDLHINYLRPMKAGSELVVRAEIMNAGTRTCVVRGSVLVDGEVKVIATSTCRIYSETKPARPALAE